MALSQYSHIFSNIHNYEITANPRNTPFFSLHGPKYDDVAQFFDPRRTKTCDILGDTIYQKQVFIDVSEEIPTTNDVFFENLISNYQTPGISDLLPIILGTACLKSLLCLELLLC